MRVTRPLISRLDPWAPPIALMVVIFVLSAQPDLNSGLGTIDLIGRKLVHAGEYALLTFLWWRALRTIATPRTAVALPGRARRPAPPSSSRSASPLATRERTSSTSTT